MSFGGSVKSALFAFAAVSGFVAGVQPKVLENLYSDIYPSDPAMRDALDLCFAQDHAFNRLYSAERLDCYRHMLMPPGNMPPVAKAATRPHINLLDLQRAAALGSMPRNDIRRQQETDALHSPH
jgi:hypothetical protein